MVIRRMGKGRGIKEKLLILKRYQATMKFSFAYIDIMRYEHMLLDIPSGHSIEHWRSVKSKKSKLRKVTR